MSKLADRVGAMFDFMLMFYHQLIEERCVFVKKCFLIFYIKQIVYICIALWDYNICCFGFS